MSIVTVPVQFIVILIDNEYLNNKHLAICLSLLR